MLRHRRPIKARHAILSRIGADNGDKGSVVGNRRIGCRRDGRNRITVAFTGAVDAWDTRRTIVFYGQAAILTGFANRTGTLVLRESNAAEN